MPQACSGSPWDARESAVGAMIRAPAPSATAARCPSTPVARPRGGRLPAPRARPRRAAAGWQRAPLRLFNVPLSAINRLHLRQIGRVTGCGKRPVFACVNRDWRRSYLVGIRARSRAYGRYAYSMATEPAIERLRLVGYARVSTDEQALYGHGLDAQETRLRDYARRRSAELVVMRDEGISGKTLERPALMRALGRIAAGESDGLVVAKLDRLTRSVIDFAMLLEWFTVARAQLVALDFDLDTSTPTGRMIGVIMASVAEWERGVIAQRTRDALAAARAKGKPVGPPAVADRAQVAARIRRMREGGATLQAICDALNAEAVPTARGGSAWRPSAVQTALGYQRRARRRRIASLPEIAARR